MVDDPKITERDGKKYCTLPNGNQVQIENEIINNPSWVDVEGAVKIIGVGDRQIRNLAEKNSWDKKYAYINKKPVAYYLKSQLDNFQRNRVTEVLPSSESNSKKGDDPVSDIQTTGKELVSPETLKDLDIVLKKVQPYVGEFLEEYKKNHERLVALEEKKSTAEKTSVFWKTTAIWIGVGGLIAFIAWFKADQINSNLNKTTGDLSSKYQDTQQELYNTKLLLNQKEDEVARLQSAQTNSQTVNASGQERK